MWIITRDHLHEKSPDTYSTCVGRGDCKKEVRLALPGVPKEARKAFDAELRKQMPFAFRLYDDDGELYYEGLSSDRDSETAFQPLDWAMADSGCTRIDYKQDDGTWETL
ncbi:hypothetical protein [Cupriavidus campinensis]|uniref:Uncharacterized protein n=1 Tax=Cupriavidus campinensis TaxID=151783 RepID=A0ABY3ET18_9BURK|nr:hypothetical protein [Cupriavidus campinensis]TSP14045.1 hypothetical protein FGG12_06130 [Cupriavidus campinensis]